MASAILLAAQGWQVTIYEKNDSVGGRARVWKKDGYTVDMGPSWYLMPEVFENFFSKLNRKRTDYYQLNKLDPYYRIFFADGDTVDIKDDKEHNRQVFARLEPGGDVKLDSYLSEASYKYKVAMDQFLYRDYRSIFQFLNRKLIVEGSKLGIFKSLDRYAKKFFSSKKARQILEYAMVFLGNSPENAPALYSIMSHVDLNLGVFFPQGGMAALVAGLEKLALELGVVIKTNQAVQAIVCKDGLAQALQIDGQQHACDYVLANADYAHVELDLLDQRHRTFKKSFWQKKVLAPTMFIIYLGLNKKLKSVVHHNLYFATDWENHFDTIFKTKIWPDDPCYYVSVASYDDLSVAPKNKENVFFLVPVAPGLDDNDEFRQVYAKKILDHFEKISGESLTDSVDFMRLYSHRDFIADYNAYQGSALGLSHTLMQTAIFRPSMRSKKVKNLFYAGQYTHPGVGVPMTLIAADIISGIFSDLKSKSKKGMS